MKKKSFQTIGEYFYWVYANMAMAHVGLKKDIENIKRLTT